MLALRKKKIPESNDIWFCRYILLLYLIVSDTQSYMQITLSRYMFVCFSSSALTSYTADIILFRNLEVIFFFHIHYVESLILYNKHKLYFLKINNF